MAPPQSSDTDILSIYIHRNVKAMKTSGFGDSSVTSNKPQQNGKPSLPNAPRVPSMAATRAYAPIRPVYDDFATAHSSITSRSASGISRANSTKSPTKQASILDRGRPLSRRIHKSLKRRKKSAENKTLSFPIPGKSMIRQPTSGFDLETSQTDAISLSPCVPVPSSDLSLMPVLPKRASGSLFMDSLKKAMLGRSSQAAKSTQNRLSLSLRWPRDSMELPVLARKVEQPDDSGVEDGRRSGISLEISKKASPADISCYIHDPFVYDADQNPVSLDGVIGSHSGALDDSQHNRKYDRFRYNHRSGLDIVPINDSPSLHEYQQASYPSHGSLALVIDSERTLMRDESTVDNIVKQYAHNNGLWDISLDSNDEDSEDDGGYLHHSGIQKKHIQRNCTHIISGNEENEGKENQEEGHLNAKRPQRIFNLMGSSGQAPSADLPRFPAFPGHQTIQSMSEGLGQSSSYGDTRKLLEITQFSPLAGTTGPFHGDTGDCLTVSRNPFRRNQNPTGPIVSNTGADYSSISRPSQPLASPLNGSMENLTHTPLLALERDISRALRRISDFSSLSQEASALHPDNGGFQSSTDSSDLLSFMGKPNQGASEPLKLLTQGFYHESALRQTWLDSQRIERVRIPIRHNQSVPSTLPVSKSTSSLAEEFDLEEMTGQDQNGTEWETVIDGGMSRVKTAGSSLANNSSAGNISPILFEHNDFSSTDRIIKHPAQIDHSHNYRYREIREGNFPVLLPSYKPYTVNGFPANSCRSISPFQQSIGDLYQPPPPLPRSHTNPFRSPPPEVITNKSKSSETLDHNRSNIEHPHRAKLGALYSVPTGDCSGDWMDEFGDPGPAIRPVATIHKPRPSNPSDHTHSESYSSSQIGGSSIADASSSALSAIIHDLENIQDIRKVETSKLNSDVEGIEAGPSGTRERALFVRKPPGAFYQSVRSRPDLLRKGSSSDHSDVTRISQRTVARSYPTNQIRHLSLVPNQYTEPECSADKDGDRSRERISDSFLYRSPLAPIKSKSWCDLYTREQLSSMHADAKIKGVAASGQTNSQFFYPAFGDALKMDGSWKRTWSPHLREWPRDNSSIKSDLSSWKRKISSIVLCLCCLFPPMLVLYGVGYLDNTMLWITNGEISSFNKAYKRVALQIACFFIIAILIIVPITVAVKVTGFK